MTMFQERTGDMVAAVARASTARLLLAALLLALVVDSATGNKGE